MKNTEIFFLNNNVGIDNVIELLNTYFGMEWSFEIEKEEKVFCYSEMTVNLYVHQRKVAGVATVQITDPLNYRDELLKRALVNATQFICMVDSETGVIQEEVTVSEETAAAMEEPTEHDEKEVAKEEIVEETTGMHEEIADEIENTISINELESLEQDMKKEEEQKKVHSFRQDQLDFLNNFKAEYKVDTEQKFDYYVKVWGEACGTNITTKRELVKSSVETLDNFINWIKKMAANIDNKEVVSPI